MKEMFSIKIIYRARKKIFFNKIFNIRIAAPMEMYHAGISPTIIIIERCNIAKINLAKQ